MDLHLVIGQQDCLHFSIEDLIASAIRGGVSHVQLREKQATTREFLEIGQRLHGLLKAYSIPLIINDRVDLALVLEAEGVHLGQADMPYPEARRLLGSNKTIGLTVETPAQMQEANRWNAQYVGVGPIFPTQTKQDAPEPVGIAGLQLICKMSLHPVIAIGGIHADNAANIIHAGAGGIAVVSAITHATDPEQTSRELKQVIHRGPT